MIWKKAGRPRVKPKVEHEDFDTTKWTREELTVIKNGELALALAVIKRWQLDGSPESEKEFIEPWVQAAKMAKEVENAGENNVAGYSLKKGDT